MHKAPSSKKYLSAATIFADWSCLKALLEWMVTKKLTAFKQLKPDICMQYAINVKQRIQSEGWKVHSAVSKTEIVHGLYQYRDFLDDHPPKHPWPEQSSVTIMGKSRRSGHYNASTEIIPRRLYVKLGRSAQAYLDNQSPAVLEAFDEFLSMKERAIASVNPSRPYRKDGRDYRLSKLGAVQIDTAVETRMRGLFPAFAQKYGFRDLNGFWAEIEFLRTCCYVVCAIFSGMRDSELCSLKVGAFSRSYGFDNEEYSWLSGITYKLEKDPKPARWMVPDAVEKAVQIAARLAAPINAQTEEELRQLLAIPMQGDEVVDRARALRVIELTKLRGTLFANWTGRMMRVQPLTNASTNTRLKKLASRFDLTIAPEDMDEVRNRAKIKPGKMWPLATHQFRRSFAVFVARNMLGDVRYLRHHFKHWSIDMTLYYASDPLFDDTLLETTLTTRDELQATVLSDWLGGDKPLAGGRSAHIMHFRSRGTPKTARDPQEVAKSLGDGVFIRGTGHSWCLATTAGCGGEGLYDAIRCINCRDSVIDKNHIGIWKEIRSQQIETLTWPDMGAPAIERAKDHIREAERVLGDLGEPVEPFSSAEVSNGL